MYPIISILSKDISSYSILALLGVLAAVFYCLWFTKKKGLSMDDMINMLAYAFIGAAIGAKLLYLIPRLYEFWKYSDIIFRDFLTFSQYILSGFVYYGGFLGAIIGSYIYCKQYNINWFAYVHIAIPSIPLFHIFGRIGCYLSGCCYGIIMDPPFGWMYHSAYAEVIDATRIPVQLMEALINVCLFIVLHHNQKKGMSTLKVLGLYCTCYGISRFLLEFLRGDIGRGVFLFSTSQWISLLIIPLGFILIHKAKSIDRDESL